VLDPTWAGLLVVGEGALLRQATVCLRAPGRYAKRDEDIRNSVEDGYSNTLTPALASVVRGVIELRGGGGAGSGGEVPPQPIDDVLASGELYKECEQLKDALEDATDARRAERRCVWIQRVEAIALIVTMLILPVTVWPALGDEYIIDGPPLHALNTLLGVAFVTGTALYLVNLWAENRLEAALVKHRKSNERIGG
jgi:hypothetical protein